MATKKSSMGRQKITMAKIPKKSNRQVTFSKRRAGLFKKASELCTLCGVEVAVIVFSPAKKVFSFGHPEVESIVNRFLSCNPSLETKGNQLVEACRNVNVRQLNALLTQTLDELEAQRKLGEELTKMRKESQSKCWWESPIDELGLQELQQLRVSLEELKNNVGEQAKKFMDNNSSTQFQNMNGMDHVDFFEGRVGNPNAGHAVPRIQNFGYGYGLF